MTDRGGMMGGLADMSEYRPADWPEPRDTFAQRFPNENWTYTPPPDANEIAAARLARPYTKANLARMDEHHPVAEFAEGLAPKEPWQYGMMLAGPGAGLLGQGIRLIPPAARLWGAAGAFALGLPGVSDKAQGGVLDKVGKAVLKHADEGAAGKLGEVFNPSAMKPSGPTSALDFWRLPETDTATRAQTDYLINPQRAYSPGIYKNPRVIAQEANAQVAPEHPAMKALFGVTRDDLWEIGQRGTRKGNIEPHYSMPANPEGSYMSENIMTPANAQRLIDTGAEVAKYPQLARGMDSWYVMDPAFRRMVELVGFEQAVRDYKRFNTVVPMFSPASDVLTEINRGTAANMMIERGEWPTFVQHGGKAEAKRGRGFPDELRDVIGHPYHSTAQAGPVGRYLATGTVDMSQPKVPLYMQASGVPETGFQTKLPVPDAHLTRGVGMADVRMTAKPGVSMKGPEFHSFGPWFREQVATPLGIEAVPAQARLWGGFAPQTGVDTAIGAPKLELLSQRIWERAAKLGINPYDLRDAVLQGKAHAVWAPLGMMGAGAMGAGTMGETARQDVY